MPSPQTAYVGIDVAFAKKKRLPVSICIVQGGRLTPVPLRFGIKLRPPAGKGNKKALNADLVEQFCRDTLQYLHDVETACSVKIQRIAIDAPSDYRRENLPIRKADAAMNENGISCFKTPSESDFENIRKKVAKHLEKGGPESRIPHANQLWMLVGFGLFRVLRKAGYECLEVYPQAIVRSFGCSEHKTKKHGFNDQLARVAERTGWNAGELRAALGKMGFGSWHDKLDAFMSAWVASLTKEDRMPCGEELDDVIWVPTMEGGTIARMKTELTESIDP